MRRNIEATVLSSFLDADYYDDENKYLFKLDPDVFSSDGFRWVAEQINRFIDAGKPMSLLYEKIDTAMEDTAYVVDWLFILGRMHLDMVLVSKHYDYLVETHRIKLAKGMI